MVMTRSLGNLWLPITSLTFQTWCQKSREVRAPLAIAVCTPPSQQNNILNQGWQ
jgi:hypothetical protein